MLLHKEQFKEGNKLRRVSAAQTILHTVTYGTCCTIVSRTLLALAKEENYFRKS
jgi:hypothetical protein